MAYIIAHGTVNGYCKVTKGASIGTEQNVLTDIRAEFDNTQTMLNKPYGYLIQMAENGVWISIVKLLFDGERSGNGEGFFAFSAFLPTNQVVEGGIIKQTLDNLLEHYLARIGDDFTKNVGIDWAFVEQASASLNEQCRKRNKVAKTNYYVTSSNERKFAYVDIHSDAEIEQYLDKPFQPEYGEYRAVFLGTHLQHPNHLATQTPLTIDFENEEYEIIWTGDKNAYPNVYLPQSIRKKEIQTKTLEFQRECYKCQTLRFAEGEINPANATLTLEIPKLEPIEYGVQFSINRPDKVVSITASLPYKPPRQSDDNRTLKFYGEEARSNWHVVITTTPNFETYERDIFPFDDATIPNGIGVSLQELQPIYIQVYVDDKENTISDRNKIQIVNKHFNRSESLGQHLNKQNNCLQFDIPENKHFSDLYEVSLTQDFVNRYTLELFERTETFYEIRLRTKAVQCPPKPNNRTIEIIVPRHIAKHGVYYDEENLLDSSTKVLGNDEYHIRLPWYNDRLIDELSFFTKGGTTLLQHKEERDIIRIVGKDNFVYRLKVWINNHYQSVLVCVMGFLLLLLLAILALYLLNDNINGWFSKGSPIENVQSGTNDVLANTASCNRSQLYIELETFLKDQEDKWNYDDISNKVKSCGIVPDTAYAYPLYEQLVWLQCRVRINGYFIAEKTNKPQEYRKYQKWKKGITNAIDSSQFADTVKLAFLSEIVNAPQKHQQNFFNAIKKERDAGRIKQKTFSELKEMWKECKRDTLIRFSGSPTGPKKTSETDNLQLKDTNTTLVDFDGGL